MLLKQKASVLISVSGPLFPRSCKQQWSRRTNTGREVPARDYGAARQRKIQHWRDEARGARARRLSGDRLQGEDQLRLLGKNPRKLQAPLRPSGKR